MANKVIPGADLDQVRKILFGEQVDQNKLGLRRVETSLGKELALLRKEMARQLAELAKTLRREHEADVERLSEEIGELTEERDGLAQEVAVLKKTLDRRSAELGRAQQRESKHFDAQLTREIKALRKEVAAKCAEVAADSSAELENVRAAAVTREQLSGFLGDVALRLVDKKQIRRSSQA